MPTYIFESGLTALGNRDKSVSQYLKAWVKQGNTIVCGAIGEGTTKEIQCNWQSPFADTSLASAYAKIEGGLQLVDSTLQSLFQTTLVWMGNAPTMLNLVLRFYALEDAKAEVMDAIKALEMMASPDLNYILPAGRIPGPVSINIGRNVILSNCAITSISIPLDKERTRGGHLVRADVNMQIQTMQMLNRSDAETSYGL